MTSNLPFVLQITLVGMGLVFAILGLLALGIALLTRLVPERPARTPPPSPIQQEQARAAAIAVALALASQARSTARPIIPPELTIVDAWQLGMRTRQMTQKGNMGRRRE